MYEKMKCYEGSDKNRIFSDNKNFYDTQTFNWNGNTFFLNKLAAYILIQLLQIENLQHLK